MMSASCRISDPGGPAERELADGTLDMKFLTPNFRQQIDVACSDCTSAEFEVGRRQIQRLQQHAAIFQNKGISDCAVLPCEAAKARRDGYEDLRRGRCIHGKLRRGQQSCELLWAD